MPRAGVRAQVSSNERRRVRARSCSARRSRRLAPPADFVDAGSRRAAGADSRRRRAAWAARCRISLLNAIDAMPPAGRSRSARAASDGAVPTSTCPTPAEGLTDEERRGCSRRTTRRSSTAPASASRSCSRSSPIIGGEGVGRERARPRRDVPHRAQRRPIVWGRMTSDPRLSTTTRIDAGVAVARVPLGAATRRSSATTPRARSRCCKTKRFDIVCSDVVMPGKDGLSMLADLRELGIDDAGHHDLRPGDGGHGGAARRASARSTSSRSRFPPTSCCSRSRTRCACVRLEEENRQLRRRVGRHEIVWKSEAMQRVMAQVDRVARRANRASAFSARPAPARSWSRAPCTSAARGASEPFVTRELRGGAVGADRIGALRPREGLVHRRGGASPRQVRAGARRHAVPRRDRRHAGGDAGQAAAVAAGRRARTHRRRASDRRRHARDRRDAPRSRGAGPQGHVSRGPLSPHLRVSDRDAVAARARRTTCLLLADHFAGIDRRAERRGSRAASAPTRSSELGALSLARQRARAP